MENSKYFENSPRSTLGADIFLSQHNGFFGKIKMFPEDFRVTEIDLAGKPIQLEGEEGLPTPSLPDKETKLGNKAAITRDDDSLSETSGKQSPSPETPDQPSFDDLTDVNNLESLLQDVLGVQVMDDLRTFSEREHSKNDPSSSKSAEPHICSHCDLQNVLARGDKSKLENNFCVGVVAEKTERAFVHKAIQCLFPHLKTSTCKLTESGSQSVNVHTNPTFWHFRKLLTNQQTEKVIRFANSKFSTRTVSLDVGDVDAKEKRTAVHRLISKHFGKFLETKTCGTGAGRQEIVVRFKERFTRTDGKAVKRKSVAIELDGSDRVYSGFTLRKENLETLDALQQLGRAVRVQPSDFSYAGVKDKKAITLQLVAIKGVGEKRLQKLIKDADLPGITVGNVHPRTAAIHIGDLTGNLFDILIRDVSRRCVGDSSEEDKVEGSPLWQELDSCFRCVKEKGFVNYFGEQRFGLSLEGESQSAAIGQSILTGKYQEAVRQILATDGTKDDPVNRAKQCFLQTGQAKEALALMPKYKSRECLILKALRRHGLDRDGCLRALYCIPHTMRQLYVHAFCSLVWNHMASERLRMYGYQVVSGDLVLNGNDKRGTRDKIREVTEVDARAGTFSIRDVVLPLPGNNIRYPSNNMGDAYKEYLEAAGLASSMYRVNELQLNIPGDYRRLIEWPRDIHWDFDWPHASDGVTTGEERKGNASRNPVMQDYSPKCCDDPSEIDDGNHVHVEKTQNEDNSCRTDRSTTKQLDCELKAKGVNLRVKFRLPSSTYATVFLRELMKN